MKKNTFLNKLLFVLIGLASINGFSQNLLTNGDLESGTINGFNINGAGYVQLFSPFSGTTTTGNFAITNNAQPMNTASFVTCSNHTVAGSNMLIIDGNTTGGQQNFWEAGNGGSGVCGLTIGATYTFSYWIRSVYGAVAGGPTPAIIGVQFLNISSFTLVSGSAIAPATAAGWQQVVYTFVPNSACVNIKLYNNNTSAVGNDFAVDDFSVTAPPQPLSLSYSYTGITCPNSSDGTITAYANNGTPPYVIYNLTGSVSQSNTSGVFTGLPAAGNYTLSVTDSAGNTVSQPNITISATPGLITSNDLTICSGSSTTLSVSGGSTGYTWSASPTDASLTTANNTSANPTVSPTQSTYYTVTSTINKTLDLVTNGNFSNGNVGFDTDYTYYTPNNPTFVQKAYGIVTNPNTWEPGFSAACVDHTSGTGRMMVVDGSPVNAGNDLVWGQDIVVTPGTNYTFSYYLQTISPGNPATIRTHINGVLIGTAFASATVCGWTQYSYVWNSGVSSLARIQLFDSILAGGGNDFALDDITFTTNIICNATAFIQIDVDPSLSAVISCGTSTSTSVEFTWPGVTGATGYNVSYQINANPIVNIGAIGNFTSYTVSSLSAGDNVTITVTPTGPTGTCFTSSSYVCVASTCSTPVGSVTVQPTCAIPTGTIVVTGPINPSPLPVPTELFISEVSDEDVGSLTYVEIYNGTGAAKNLANYKIKVYNNGNTFFSCDIPLSGTLNNNDVYVISIGSVVNQGGVVPDFVISGCPGINNNDNIRLTTSADVEIDLWGRTDGVVFTPANQPGYTFRRLTTAPHPTLTWNINDWLALDPQDYTDVGNYTYQVANYEYSVDGVNYQSSPTFSGLAPNTYNVTIRETVSGCVSNAIQLTVNAVPTVAAPTASATVQPTCPTPTGTIVVSAPLGANYEYSVNGVNYQASPTFSGLVPNNYNVTVRNITNGCTSTATSITINPVGSAPNVSGTTFNQADCTVGRIWTSYTCIGI